MQLKKSLTIITKILLGAFVIAYPFVIFYMLQQNIAIRFIGLILVMVVALSFVRNKNKYLFMLGLLLCFLVIFFNQAIFLKFYPVLMNAGVFSVFALSLKKVPLVTQIAQRTTKDNLDEAQLTYTKLATIAWAIFMFCNTIASLITVFLPYEIWAIYNGFIAYILIGIMMAAEYTIRKVKRKCSHQ